MNAEEYKDNIRSAIVAAFLNAVENGIDAKNNKLLLEAASLGGGLISEEAMGREAKQQMGFVIDENVARMIEEAEEAEEAEYDEEEDTDE